MAVIIELVRVICQRQLKLPQGLVEAKSHPVDGEIPAR
ncbi:hypothetical protein CCACVL1_21323 [Corchorus capsularis]|uniref:Uncharacterized protein n=1 Tax=Corchorus capsularis TaxID=210143 RepID=A0A1R3H6X2_COCAP|nr:hypothetical protein CCACVL1_21323 [Corchorus capsularis]